MDNFSPNQQQFNQGGFNPNMQPNQGFNQPMQNGQGNYSPNMQQNQGFNQQAQNMPNQGYNQPMQGNQGFNQPVQNMPNQGYNQQMSGGYSPNMYGNQGYNQPMQNGYNQQMYAQQQVQPKKKSHIVRTIILILVFVFIVLPFGAAILVPSMIGYIADTKLEIMMGERDSVPVSSEQLINWSESVDYELVVTPGEQYIVLSDDDLSMYCMSIAYLEDSGENDRLYTENWTKFYNSLCNASNAAMLMYSDNADKWSKDSTNLGTLATSDTMHNKNALYIEYKEQNNFYNYNLVLKDGNKKLIISLVSPNEMDKAVYTGIFSNFINEYVTAK